MTPSHVLFLFLFIFSHSIFSMEKLPDEDRSVIVDKKVELNLTTYYLDFQRHGTRLSKESLKSHSLDIPSYLSGINVHEEIADLFATAFFEKVNNSRFIFVDFDGVLGMQVLEKGERKFRHILNTPNCILEPQSIRARELMASDKSAEARGRVVAKLRSVGMEILDDPEEEVSAIMSVMAALRMTIAGDNKLGFSEKYSYVDETLRHLLQAQKAQGAHLFVLSAKGVTEEKKQFLLEFYGDIFAPNPEKSALKMEFFQGQTYDPSCSYFFAHEKDVVIGLTPPLSAEQTVEIAFFDDHLARMSMYYAPRATYHLRGHIIKKISAVFIPYPMLSLKFDENEYVNEIFDVINELDEFTLQQLVTP